MPCLTRQLFRHHYLFVHSGTRVFLRCMHCGHTTPGWSTTGVAVIPPTSGWWTRLCARLSRRRSGATSSVASAPVS